MYLLFQGNFSETSKEWICTFANEFFSNLIESNDWGEYSLLLIKNAAKFLYCVEYATKKCDYSYSLSLFYMMTIFLKFHIRRLVMNLQVKHISIKEKNSKNNQNTEFWFKITDMKI